MAQTVIGMFDNSLDARHAVDKLYNSGFSRDQVDLTSSGDDMNAASGNEEETGISKFFKNIFSNKEDSDKYVKVARYSESVVTVYAGSEAEAQTAANILDSCGAVNVDERAAQHGYSVANSDAEPGGENSERLADVTPSTVEPPAAVESPGKTTKIPVIEEHLKIGKREILTGGTRMRSRIIEQPVEQSMHLREETVRLDRSEAGRVASATDLANFQPRVIELKETAEVPVVSKEARVVEEVRIAKEVNERTETVSDTVRRTEVTAEDLDAEVKQEQQVGNHKVGNRNPDR